MALEETEDGIQQGAGANSSHPAFPFKIFSLGPGNGCERNRSLSWLVAYAFSHNMTEYLGYQAH
jgi:hypothetical protein